MTLGEVLTKTISFLKSKNFEGARWEAEHLIAHGLGVERVQLYLKQDYPLSVEETDRLRDLVRQRGMGVPLAYVVGEKGFFKSTFIVAPGILIPRSDSEVLVEKLLERIPQDADEVVMDWGSGSGCLGISLLLERPNLKLIAVDPHDEPVKITKANADRHGLNHRVEVLQKPAEELSPDDVAVFGKQPKYLIANPPYVAKGDQNLEKDVFNNEPHSALFSEDQGLHHLKTWITKALEIPSLEDMIFEFGYDQAYPVREFISQIAPGVETQIHKDLGGRERAVSFHKRKSE